MPAIAELAAEPLLAIAEHEDVLGCGPAGCPPETTHSVVPSAFRFDRVAKNAAGLYESSSGQEIAIPGELREAWEVHGAAHGSKQVCLPWVRIARDPKSFRSCLAAAVAIGPMKKPSMVYKLLREFMAQQDQEVFVVVLLDTQMHVRGVGEISRGARDSVQTPIPDILRLPMVDGAKAMIVAHNHPSGMAKQPSKADKALTKTLSAACSTVEIELYDHLIVCPDDYYSFANEGLL
jgi:DNA repair protein RadC